MSLIETSFLYQIASTTVECYGRIQVLMFSMFDLSGESAQMEVNLYVDRI